MPSRTLLRAASVGCVLAVVACGRPNTEHASPVASVTPAPMASEAPPPAPAASVPVAVAPKPAFPEGMALVPGGIFWMGSDYATEEEAPRHRVAIRSFAMDVYELTVADYAACVAAGACTAAHSDHSLCNAGHAERADHPINCIDWSQAVAGCAFRGKRLPTEREWEYAARGGSEQRPFPWGTELPPGHACYSHEGTCKVGSYAPSAFGLYDVGGNVWEWTASRFGPYPDEIEEGSLRVYRGGSFSRRFPKWMRNGLRNRFKETEWGAHLGVRCAKDVEGATCPAGSRDAAKGTGCVLDSDTDTKPASVVTSSSNHAAAVSSPAPAAPTGKPKEPLSVVRDGSFDGDCSKWKPGRPVAYMIRGAEFADRQRKKAELGCVNRDVGVGFNSVCCAN